jgi:HSF-type DNA-binding
MKVTPNSIPEQNNLSFLPKNKQDDMMASDEGWGAKLPNNESVVHMRLPFVHKLFLMLNDLEAKGYDHVISWIGDGKAFKIHDPSIFEASIQPQYFRQSRLASFVRQVSQVFSLKGTKTQ